VFLATRRIGVSRLAVDVGSLGSQHSWGYGSTGKKSTGNMYTPYPVNQVSDQAATANRAKASERGSMRRSAAGVQTCGW
jgi:hypothetical protein